MSSQLLVKLEKEINEDVREWDQVFIHAVNKKWLDEKSYYTRGKGFFAELEQHSVFHFSIFLYCFWESIKIG